MLVEEFGFLMYRAEHGEPNTESRHVAPHGSGSEGWIDV